MTAHQTKMLVIKGLRAAWSLLWMFVATFVLAVMLTLLVKETFGDFEQYREWQEAHLLQLFLWRLCMYTGLAIGWLKIRRRLASTQDAGETRKRLVRCELLVVVLVSIFEIKHTGLL